MFKNYWFYYYWSFVFINQLAKDYEFTGLSQNYFLVKFNVFQPTKTKIPGLCISIVIFGLGFEFCTHSMR